MTTMHDLPIKCILCGQEQNQSVMTSTNSFGSPDLDLRPPEMKRSTMFMWLQSCCNCGYVAPDLSEEVRDGAQKIVNSLDYKLAEEDDYPSLAKKFIKWSLICSDDVEHSGFALLRAAWACDDQQSYTKHAKDLREKVASQLLTLRPFSESEDSINNGCILVDVLRRCEKFDEGIELATELLKSETCQKNEVITKVLEFQISLCGKKDVKCYTVEQAVR